MTADDDDGGDQGRGIKRSVPQAPEDHREGHERSPEVKSPVHEIQLLP